MKSLLVVGWTLGVLTGLTTPGRAQTTPATLLAAHRGGAALWPENSLLAFRSSAQIRGEP